MEWIAHVSRRGWRKVALLTAGWAVTSSHNEGGGRGRGATEPWTSLAKKRKKGESGREGEERGEEEALR
jgi:hypothetical protein